MQIAVIPYSVTEQKVLLGILSLQISSFRILSRLPTGNQSCTV